MENRKSKGPEACFGYRHGYTSIPSPRKPASYYLFVDAVNASIPRREWMLKRKESSKDEETVDNRGTVPAGCGPGAAAAFAVDSTTSFNMVRSEAAVDNDCLKGAKANVDVRTTPTDNQIMDVTLNHAPKNTEFELFVTQQPNSPFGLSWYQADFETNNQGQGEVRARGIFSEELFVFAPGA